ncbi:MAG: glycosyltransferase family 4 protein [Hyphomicrobium sp.]|uniref:glycosyltransferase family 4 protein n=1 Tax=Hyphomicrobium sp. TaxID=82 RepID=UPI0039E35CF1
MKVLIVNNMAPFIWGGAEELASHLCRNIQIAGHDAEVLRIPFQWEPAYGIPAQMLLVRTLELTNVDLVIALKFPAYLVRHPNKVLWLLHQYRQAYDLHDAGQSNLPEGRDGVELRSVIKTADNESFSECTKIFTNSEVTKQRLQKYNGVDAKVLLPPINDPELFQGGPLGDYIFAGGRVNSMKRQHLLLEALARTSDRVRLVIGGPPDNQADANLLRATVDRLGLESRVTLDLRFLPRDVYANYVNGSRAVAYLPFDEDSLGYVAMEGANASKALLTTSDSGGILGLVHHKTTGWVAEPTAQALADVMDEIFTDESACVGYGREARIQWDDLGISWPETVKALLR